MANQSPSLHHLNPSSSSSECHHPHPHHLHHRLPNDPNEDQTHTHTKLIVVVVALSAPSDSSSCLLRSSFSSWSLLILESPSGVTLSLSGSLATSINACYFLPLPLPPRPPRPRRHHLRLLKGNKFTTLITLTTLISHSNVITTLNYLITTTTINVPAR